MTTYRSLYSTEHRYDPKDLSLERLARVPTHIYGTVWLRTKLTCAA